MRKRVIARSDETRPLPDDGGWLDLERCATVEVSSEDPEHPIEAALVAPFGRGWRASAPGPQSVRLCFDEPQRVRRIFIEVHEAVTERTQEMTISCVTANGQVQEVLLQRWNFSPRGSTIEREDYRVDLRGIKAIEVAIRPDVGNQGAVASMTQLRIA